MPESVGVLGLCASIIVDVVGTTTRSRALIKTLEENIRIVSSWSPEYPESVTVGLIFAG
jgi:hypothetical protein